MAFRFVRQRGFVIQTPTVITIQGSGTLARGAVVEFARSRNRVEPATSSTTFTSILGVSVDSIDTDTTMNIRVVPFIQGQLWEADCTSTPTDEMLLRKHALTNSVTLANTTTDQTNPVGVFLTYMINTAKANTMIGEFIRVLAFDKLNGQQ